MSFSFCRSLLLFFSIVLIAISTQSAFAFSTGVVGKSGAEDQTCAQCHSGGELPTVDLVGPTTDLIPGTTVQYELIVKSSVPQEQTHAGIDVGIIYIPTDRYADGIVPADDTTKRIYEDLTHSAPKANDENGQASFFFEWVVPNESGNYRIFFAGNSVNLNGTTRGDMVATDHQNVTVLEPTPEPVITGDVNCDNILNLIDPVLIQRFNASMIEATADCSVAQANTAVYEAGCDINGDDICSLVDSIIISQCNTGMDNPFCE